VLGISVGFRHTVACTVKGVYTFGMGAYGELGHGERSDYRGSLPRRVQALTGRTVVGAAANEAHTVVWTATGELYTCGRGLQGRLGLGVRAGSGGQETPTPLILPLSPLLLGRQENELEPMRVEALVEEWVVGAAAGKEFTVVWTRGGPLCASVAPGRSARSSLGSVVVIVVV
jgi:hypothetical protein